MRRYMSATTAARIDCTFDAERRAGRHARTRFDRIRQEAEEAVRGGCQHIVLTDDNVDRRPRARCR